MPGDIVVVLDAVHGEHVHEVGDLMLRHARKEVAPMGVGRGAEFDDVVKASVRRGQGAHLLAQVALHVKDEAAESGADEIAGHGQHERGRLAGARAADDEGGAGSLRERHAAARVELQQGFGIGNRGGIRSGDDLSALLLVLLVVWT